MKTFKASQFKNIKDVATVVIKNLKEINKLQKKLSDIQNALKEQNEAIEYQDKYVFDKYGVHMSDVVKIETIEVYDKDGKAVKKTVINPTDAVSWNDENKVYEYTELSDVHNDNDIPADEVSEVILN